MPFSASEAGLEGFRITRENPRAFARWAFFSFAVSVVAAFITVLMPAEVRNAMQTLSADDVPDGKKLLDAVIAVIPLMVMGLAIQCMMAAAVYRIILRHDDARFGYLRLGRDEFRLMGLTLIFGALFIVGVAALTLVAGLVTALASVAGQGTMVFVGLVAEVFVFGLIIYVLVRLSLAPVVTFAERRLVIFGVWPLTRGYFWKLFGAYVLAVLAWIVVALLAMVVFVTIVSAILLATGGQISDLKVIFSPDDTSLLAYLHPAMIAYTVVGSVVTALWYAVLAAPGAIAYQHLHGAAPPSGGEQPRPAA